MSRGPAVMVAVSDTAAPFQRVLYCCQPAHRQQRWGQHWLQRLCGTTQPGGSTRIQLHHLRRLHAPVRVWTVTYITTAPPFWPSAAAVRASLQRQGKKCRYSQRLDPAVLSCGTGVWVAAHGNDATVAIVTRYWSPVWVDTHGTPAVGGCAASGVHHCT